MGLNIYQLAYLLSDGLVEIEQIVPALLEERPQVVLVIVKERRLAIGTLNSIPVQMSPVAMVADAEVLYQHGVTMFYWHRECLDTIGGCNETTIPEGLLLEILPPLYLYILSPMQLLIPLHRTEIGCTQQNSLHSYLIWSTIRPIRLHRTPLKP